MDRILLIQFQFETHNVKGNRNDFTCCSLDKYLSLDVWSQIYTKLEAPFERYKNNVNHHPKSETIQLRRAQLDLRVSWPKCETYHTDVIDHMVKDMDKEKENGCDVCPYVMLINVSMVSVLDKYKKLHSNTKKTDTTTAKSDKRSSDDSNETRQSASSSTNDTEEYVPAARTNVSSGLKYTPSTLVGSTSTEQLTSDEYTPTKRETIEDEHGSVSYTPTKIVQSDKTSFRGTAEQKHKAATDLNRKNCTEKKKRLEPRYSTDLFDSDSNNEDVKQPNTRSKYDGLVIPSTPLDSPNEPHKTATDLNRNDCTEKKKRFGRHNSAYLFGDDLNSEAVSQSSIRSKYDRQVKQSTSLDLPNKSHKTETDLNRNDCTEKKKRLAVQNSGELFGDDPNSKVVNQSGVRSKYDRLVKQPTSLDSPKPHKTQTNLSSWVTTERGKKTHISKVHGGGSDENSKKRKIDAISPIELSTPKPPNKVDDELEKMRKLRQEMDELYEDVTVDRMMYVCIKFDLVFFPTKIYQYFVHLQ